ncbi:ABC transporter permease [Phaeocystidibacter marisrubri]|uniref:ABC transporter permease n=1 Tax=Phaeocystidibacter marisrubri TaxID=1577780 RepID=A0A6L3ZIW0_9FLAO|nr:ABC transporter permease [Phaeocystidibacter marisrubri]KAB2817821.1 ABC transporter permease [Phaeocystidibacter marisrubri]GGH73351.1 ABC transporter ATP-binding protein [Phaeocystidibacter marisrubri]
MSFFDIDRWTEIWQTLSKNRARTILTGFGVAWGIALLIIMMASGQGLQNGIMQDMGNFASNSTFLWTQRTNMPYKGFQRGRYFNMRNDDIQILYNKIPDLKLICPRNQLGGYRGTNNVIHKDKTGAFTVYGDIPEYMEIEPKAISQGRWMNQSDLLEKRKICIIGKRVADMMYDRNEEIIGNSIQINGVYFTVVGVYETLLTGERAEEDQKSIFVPFTTFQRAFNYGDVVGWISMLGHDHVNMEDVQAEVKKVLAVNHTIHPEDTRAFGSWSMQTEYVKLQGLFMGIKGLSLFVSIFSLMAGAIGVSNIMLVVVKERTQELGVRRALGATPRSIIVQIMSESLILTLIAGFLGIMFGTWLMALIDTQIGDSIPTFLHPSVSLPTVLMAMGILVLFGVIAGLLPATRAVRVKPVDALRAE